MTNQAFAALPPCPSSHSTPLPACSDAQRSWPRAFLVSRLGLLPLPAVKPASLPNTQFLGAQRRLTAGPDASRHGGSCHEHEVRGAGRLRGPPCMRSTYPAILGRHTRQRTWRCRTASPLPGAEASTSTGFPAAPISASRGRFADPHPSRRPVRRHVTRTRPQARRRRSALPGPAPRAPS